MDGNGETTVFFRAKDLGNHHPIETTIEWVDVSPGFRAQVLHTLDGWALLKGSKRKPG